MGVCRCSRKLVCRSASLASAHPACALELHFRAGKGPTLVSAVIVGVSDGCLGNVVDSELKVVFVHREPICAISLLG